MSATSGQPAKYTAADHKRAFELYEQLGSVPKVAKTLDILTVTIWRWFEPTFTCSEGCAFHGWDNLVLSKQKSIKSVIAAGENLGRPPNQEETECLVTYAVKDVATTVTPTIAAFVRSDIERIEQMEFLYAQVFFKLTGTVIKFPEHLLKDDSDVDNFQHKQYIQEVLGRGISFEQFDRGFSTLKDIMNQIDMLKGRLRLPQNEGGLPPEQKAQITEGNRGNNALEQIRALRKMVSGG